MTAEITLVGNLTRDPEIKVFESGNQLVKTAVAVTERYFDKAENAWKDRDPSYFELIVFNGMGDNVAASLTKGARVVVTGTIRVRDWEDGDKKGRSVEILVNDIGPSLRWATAEVTKNPKREGTGGGAPAAKEEDFFNS